MATLMEAKGRSLLIVVPAYRRLELAAVCYRQMADALAKARRNGLDARAVVIADDENLDLAAKAGLFTIEHPNRLGAKLNAGYTYAARNHFDCVGPAGSDEFLDPARYRLLPSGTTMCCTRNYVAVKPAGFNQAYFRLSYDGGVGQRIFPTALLAECHYQPLEPDRPHGCDTTTLWRIRRDHDDVEFVYTDLAPCEVVGFQSRQQITTIDRLIERGYFMEWQPPFQGMVERYGKKHVQAMQRMYRANRVQGG